jgi:hypothetical protein
VRSSDRTSVPLGRYICAALAVQPGSKTSTCKTEVRQRCSIVPAAQPCDNCLRQSRAVSGQPPPAILDAQGAGDGARLFHERGSYVLDEFSSFYCSQRARLSHVSCLRRRWRLLSPQSKLSDVARWLLVLQMSQTASEVRLSQFHSPVA